MRPQAHEFLGELDNHINGPVAATTRKNLFRTMRNWVGAVEEKLEEDHEALLQLQSQMASLQNGHGRKGEVE